MNSEYSRHELYIDGQESKIPSEAGLTAKQQEFRWGMSPIICDSIMSSRKTKQCIYLFGVILSVV